MKTRPNDQTTCQFDVFFPPQAKQKPSRSPAGTAPCGTNFHRDRFFELAEVDILPGFEGISLRPPIYDTNQTRTGVFFCSTNLTHV